MNPVLLFAGIFLAALVVGSSVAVVVSLGAIQKDLRHIREMLTAYMEREVAGTLADHKLAAAVDQSKKKPVMPATVRP